MVDRGTFDGNRIDHMARGVHTSEGAFDLSVTTEAPR